MNWIEKRLAPVRMGTTSSTIMQSLGEIEQRAPAVGAKMWCFLSRSDPVGCAFDVIRLRTIIVSRFMDQF